VLRRSQARQLTVDQLLRGCDLLTIRLLAVEDELLGVGIRYARGPRMAWNSSDDKAVYCFC